MMRISLHDRGSLPLAMLLTLVGVGLTGLIATTVLGQVTGTRYDGDRAAAMDAAQSGIETGLAQMRGLPVDANGDALLTDLPCVTTSATSPDLTIAGPVSPAGPTRFSVNIYYVTQAPPATTDAEAWARTNRVGCLAAGPATAPMYALLAATGTAGAEARTVTATCRPSTPTTPPSSSPTATPPRRSSPRCGASTTATTSRARWTATSTTASASTSTGRRSRPPW